VKKCNYKDNNKNNVNDDGVFDRVAKEVVVEAVALVAVTIMV